MSGYYSVGVKREIVGDIANQLTNESALMGKRFVELGEETDVLFCRDQEQNREILSLMKTMKSGREIDAWSRIKSVSVARK